MKALAVLALVVGTLMHDVHDMVPLSACERVNGDGTTCMCPAIQTSPWLISSRVRVQPSKRLEFDHAQVNSQ